MAGEYRMDGLAVPESLDELHALLETVRKEHPEVDATALMLFETAVVEIHGNVIKHGRPEGKVAYVFTLQVLDDRLAAHLATTGDETPDLSQLPLRGPDDLLAESGRGLWLADTVLDALEFTRAGDQNAWLMVKLLDGSAQPDARP